MLEICFNNFKFQINQNFHDKLLETFLARTRVNPTLLAPESGLSGQTCQFCRSSTTWQENAFLFPSDCLANEPYKLFEIVSGQLRSLVINIDISLHP